MNDVKKMFIGGNWKCNGTRDKVNSLVSMLNGYGDLPANAEVVVAPPAIHIQFALSNLRKDVQVSVQNVWIEPSAGAWTGELTTDLVKDFGVNWTILGHSERRAMCHESPEVVGKKVAVALKGGLRVIACIGEQLADRENGKTMDVCREQLKPILAAIPQEKLKDVVIAYEPVWAIGTGVTATPTQAQDTHFQIRTFLAGEIGDAAAANMRIIYGGSVKANNCDELMKKADIDGFLVGGASMNDEFLKIIGSSAIKSKI